MADPTPQVPDPLTFDLQTKPDCPIKYTFTNLAQPSDKSQDAVLVLFINGLGLPQAFWQPVLNSVRGSLAEFSASSQIFAATYDRYGQGLSQPVDGARPRPHDIIDAVQDLKDIVDALQRRHLAHAQNVKLFLVAHSIGGPLARLFCQHHPGLISALLILDSNPASTDFVSLFPDPDDATFDPDSLPSDTTVDQLRNARAMVRQIFHPSAPNRENLDRSTLPGLLPLADGPKLRGAGPGGTMVLSIVSHEPEAFAVENLKVCTLGLTERCVEPFWTNYNQGLLQLADNADDTAKAVRVAPGCGHFVQRDNPGFVAEEIIRMIKLLV